MLTERLQVTGFVPATGAGTLAGTFVAAGAVNEAGSVAATFTLVPGSVAADASRERTSSPARPGRCPSVRMRSPARTRPARRRARSCAGGGTSSAARGRTRASRQGANLATGDFGTGEITIARDGKVKRGNDHHDDDGGKDDDD